jgi:predicted dehydrogenase
MPRTRSSRSQRPPRDGARTARRAGSPRRASSRSTTSRDGKAENRKVRYAVVGLGHIAQAAVLPAFRNARRNSVLAALVSDDPKKQAALGRKYGVQNVFSYDEYDDCLRSGEIDAVYIALPNDQHRDYAVRAARAGIHVLCEKPLALTEDDCEDMIRAAEEHGVRLMTAYRLHFDPGNLEAIRLVQSGKIGEPRYFSSTFSMQVKAGDIRLQKAGGGTLWDIGVYCINAARYLFRDEPMGVFAYTANRGEERFREVDEACGAVMKFPGERVATFITSFGAADRARYEIVGTKGSIQVDDAYEYAMPMQLTLKVGEREQKRRFRKHDQFAAELLHFSDCVRTGREPEPSGWEGLIDVAIVRALYRSAEIGKPVDYVGPSRTRRPDPRLEIVKPPVEEPELVHTSPPTKD